MDILTKELSRKFENKYLHLKLLEINYDSHSLECEVVFLYPYTHSNIPESDRAEIQKFLSEFFRLNSKIKVKFKKSFLDGELVIKKITEFFESNYKSMVGCIEKDDISSNFENLNLKIQIKTVEEIKKFLDSGNIVHELLEFLNNNFYADISLEVVLDPNKIIVEAENRAVILRPRTERYSVNIIKNGFGGGIVPSPEFIKNIVSPKLSCILGGTIEGLKRGEFKPKKPKTEDESRFYYSFTLNDNSGKIPVVYFASMSGAKVMDSLSDGVFVLLTGDVRRGMTDKLTFYIKKLALASLCTEAKPADKKDKQLPDKYIRVFPEKLESHEQDNLFHKKVYNDNILNHSFVVFDVETTGLDAEACEIIELAAVKIVGGVIVEKFESLVMPTKEISNEITLINGITNEMVKDAPPVEEVILDFFRFTRGCVLSGYNVGFDVKFIVNAAHKVGLIFENEIQDVLALVRTSGIKSKNLKLGVVCKEFGIELSNAHRAFYDTYATAELFLQLSIVKPSTR